MCRARFSRREHAVQLGGLDLEIAAFGPGRADRPVLIARKIVLRDTPVAVAASVRVYAIRVAPQITGTCRNVPP